MTDKPGTRVRITFAKIFLPLAIITIVSGCTRHRTQEPGGIFNNRSYIDLQAGWRVRVVVPVLKSGKFKVQTQPVRTIVGSVQLKTTDDFQGYETDFYAVRSTGRSGISIQFTLAEVTDINGKRKAMPQPSVPLFVFPQGIQYVRLLFLTRVSQAEHNEAIIGTSSLTVLEELTNQLAKSPDDQCKNSAEEVCSWVPEGISIQPEKKPSEKGKGWVPAT